MGGEVFDADLSRDSAGRLPFSPWRHRRRRHYRDGTRQFLQQGGAEILRGDYRKFCGDYGLESTALRVCMDKAGKGLSKSCVKALIQSGEVSQAEVDRRKASGR